MRLQDIAKMALLFQIPKCALLLREHSGGLGHTMQVLAGQTFLNRSLEQVDSHSQSRYMQFMILFVSSWQINRTLLLLTFRGIWNDASCCQFA